MLVSSDFVRIDEHLNKHINNKAGHHILGLRSYPMYVKHVKHSKYSGNIPIYVFATQCILTKAKEC